MLSNCFRRSTEFVTLFMVLISEYFCSRQTRMGYLGTSDVQSKPLQSYCPRKGSVSHPEGSLGKLGFFKDTHVNKL